tara:strand:- start:23 stop:148 length:126 start_codon:yes stop_codon:yes gene_type:complete
MNNTDIFKYKLVEEKTGKEIIPQEPISPLGSKLLNSLNKWK